MIKTNDMKKISVTKMNLIPYFAVFLLFTSLLSWILTSTVWPRFIPLIHISFELTCVFISLCIFGIVWVASDFNDILPCHRLLGFGLLIVAILDVLHLITFNTLALYPLDYSIRYGIMARLIEGIVFLFASSTILQGKLKNKLLVLLFSICIAISLILLIQVNTLFPPLLAENGFTFSARLIQYFILGLYIFALLHLQVLETMANRFSYYPYLFLAILSFIASGFNYTQLTSSTYFFMLFGHILKLSGYLFLLRGVFVLSLINPYKELNHSKKYLNEILDQLPIGIIKYDTESTVSYTNRQALDYFESEISDICNITRDELYMKFKIVDSIADHKMKKLETTKGNEFIFHTSDISVDNGLISTITDAKVEQELSIFNIQTHMILNSINNLIIIMDKDYKIIDCNTACLECIEIKKEDVIGLSIFDYNDLIQIKYRGQDYRADEVIREDFNEFTLVTPKGMSKTILSQFKSVTNVYDEVIGYVSIAIDLTPLKKEQELLKNQERLALIGQMGSGIVHETKNYLASIKGYCELLLCNLEDERHKGYVNKIQFLANDMNGLVTEYLNLSKPSEIILDIISLNELIESIKYILESPSFVQESTLKIDLCKIDLEVLADDTHIKQVIINLSKNAIEAMKGIENGQLTIQTKCSDNAMHLIISDNGMGISQDNLAKLGTPFFTTKKTGTGLGLSNCYKIIQDCGGQIFVESEIGKGTTFTIELPIYEDETELTENIEFIV